MSLKCNFIATRCGQNFETFEQKGLPEKKKKTYYAQFQTPFQPPVILLGSGE
jgi:hypothetical protein